MKPYDFDAAQDKKTGQLIDDAVRMRKARMDREKVVDGLKSEERQLAELILARLETEKVESMKGRRGTASLRVDEVPEVVDWTKFHKHIQNTGSFELLQRRPAVGAYREAIADGERIPGVRTNRLRKLSLTERR